MESWKQGLKAVADLPRRLQAHAAAVDQQDRPGAGQDGRRAAARRAGQERPARGRAAQAARRAAVAHAQVLRRGSRGLHPRRPLRDRRAGRDLREDGQGGLDDLGPHGQLRDGDLAGAAARRAAAPARRQVLAHALRALRVHREPGDSAGELDHGLPLPLAGAKFVKRDAEWPRPSRRPIDASGELKRVAEVVAGRAPRSRSSTSAPSRQRHNGHANGNGKHAHAATATTASSPAPTRRPAPNADRS